MNLIERIWDEVRALPVHLQQEALDFVLTLRQRQARLESDMDAVIAENMEALEELAK